MGQRSEELTDVLEQLSMLLEQGSDAHWTCWIRKAQTLLIDSDEAGITCLLSAYGGFC